MTTFRYLVYDSHGAKLKGQIEAQSLAQAKEQLGNQKYVVVSLDVVRNEKDGISLFRRNSKVGLKNLEFLISEMAILLKSGVRIDKGLNILSKGAPDPASVTLLQSLSKSVTSGQSIADAFAEHPTIFDPLFINMIKLGEASGNLDEVFAKLAEELKFRRELQSKIVQSLTYPSVILLVCISCILFVFNYIVPQMSGIFDRSQTLPVYTEILLGVSDWFIQYQWYLAIALFTATILFIRGLKNPKFQLIVDEIGLKTPLIHKGILLVERIRFNSSMAMMLSSGVSLVNSMALSLGNVKNRQIAHSLKTSENKVRQGTRLSDALQSTPLFTDFNISLVEVGEESGDLEPVFSEIASRSRQDFESWTNTLTNMIEPLLILVMGGIVGSVVIVMLLSIVSTNDIGL